VGILSNGFDVREEPTERTGHATELARQGIDGGFDVVAALGGDGTVNEVANALAGTTVPLGIVPGGGADVFARSLGIPKDVKAAAALLTAPGHARKQRRVPLGRVVSDEGPAGRVDRYFVANCGMGLDAAIVRSVERRPQMKRLIGDWYFVVVGLGLFFAGGFDRKDPHVRVTWGEQPSERKDQVFVAIVQNTTPYTFLGRRGLRLCPDARLDGGVDCFAIDTLRAGTVLPIVLSAFGSARRVADRHVTYVRNRSRFVIEGDRPMPAQVDGEYIGERTELVVESVPDALSVLC
jgi:diacylglycerol kinase family enzyme